MYTYIHIYVYIYVHSYLQGDFSDVGNDHLIY